MPKITVPEHNQRAKVCPLWNAGVLSHKTTKGTHQITLEGRVWPKDTSHPHTHTHRAQPCKTCGKCSDLAPVSVSGAKLCQSENLPNTFPACVCHRQVSFCKADTKSSSTACTHTCCSLECFMKEGALHSAWKGNTGIPDPFNFKATCCNVKNWMENQFIETTTKKRKFGTWKWNTQTKHLSDCLTSPFQDVEEQ